MTGRPDLEAMIATLESSGEYRVLRRLKPRAFVHPPDGTPVKQAVFLDLETTGVDPAGDEIIEIAMLPFSYAVDGRIYAISEPFQRLRQPSKPIPEQITTLTGITDAMVEGRTIDPAEVAAFLAPVSLVVAHNAGFDRRFAERFCDAFERLPWACSIAGCAWREEGFASTALASLGLQLGYFFDGHRALDDCRAGIELLASTLPRSGASVFARVLEHARRPILRVWAEGAPFEFKDVLKARGYRWNAGDDGRPRAWYADLDEDLYEAELQFLREEVYGYPAEPTVTRITAYERFSARC